MSMMNTFTGLSLCLLCLALAMPCAAASTNEPREIRVLLTTGGHDFEQKQFFEMFDNLPGIKCTRVTLPLSAGLLKPGLEKEYDVIVMYDMVTAISAEQRKAFVELLRTGIGVVALHHNLGAHRDWDEYPSIIGGKYLHKPWKRGDKEFGTSTYEHGQDLDVKVADKQHPIALGITDFQIHDETYQHYYTSTDAHVLLTTDHPKSDHSIAWVTRYENSPVFYLLLGHDAKAWQNPVYPKLLLNGIHWASMPVPTKPN
jgi:type 1 glutamine amidotransferase